MHKFINTLIYKLFFAFKQILGARLQQFVFSKFVINLILHKKKKSLGLNEPTGELRE